ncbi:MAG: type IV toxin-antitoxin system AbiEi family antitoxin domain-containing protein [Coriobacteriales bacterium]|jgi:predicted transcriptional regulator of viral defense system|nr:type IV toxin-antitoxin system AbiEi family antitoxin domain-containing protein [Coriobacteriales bacterium]
MMKTLARTTLWDTAIDQHGYVTAAQARDVGISQATVTMLVQRGKLERAGWGLYRFPEIPVTQYDQYALAVLWTGVPEATLSHETALDCYAISDINPNLIHITVNPARRIRRSGGEEYVVHYETLSHEQVGWWEQIPIVKPVVAVEQCIDYGTPTYLLVQAIENGHKDGYLKKTDRDTLMERLEKRHE